MALFVFIKHRYTIKVPVTDPLLVSDRKTKVVVAAAAAAVVVASDKMTAAEPGHLVAVVLHTVQPPEIEADFVLEGL